MLGLDTLSIVRLVSPAVVLPAVVSLYTVPSQPIQLPGIRPIVTQRITPRKTLILTLLSLISLSYFADGAVFVAEAVITGLWDQARGTSWAVYTLGNLILWSVAAILVVARNGYTRRGLPVATCIALTVEIVYLIFSAIRMGHGESFPVLIRINPVSSLIGPWCVSHDRHRPFRIRNLTLGYTGSSNTSLPNSSLGSFNTFDHIRAGHASHRKDKLVGTRK